MNKRYLLLAFLLVAATGCQSMWMNQGKLVSVLAAGQVGHWPQSRNELIQHGCQELDDANLAEAESSRPFEPAPMGCQFFVKLQHLIELRPQARNLRMVLRDQAGKLVCNLLVIVPPNDGRDALLPQIKMRTTLMGCPGEGKSW